MSTIKLKDLLHELQLKEAPVTDTPPATIISPPAIVAYAKAAGKNAGNAYGKAASDAAGKPHTSNIDFRNLKKAEDPRVKKILDVLNGSGDFLEKAAKIIAPMENNKAVKTTKNGYKNYDPKTDTWNAYPDKDGWSIGYGHWSPTKPSGAITDKQAMINLKNDIASKVSLAKKLIRNFEKFPDNVKFAIVNSLYRGEKSPKAFAELNKPNPNFKNAAELYSNTKDKSALGRMKINAELIALGGD